MTYRRVLADTVKPKEFESFIQEYHQGRLNDELEMVFSIDGEAIRGAIPSGELRGTHLLSIYVPEQGLVLAEAEVDRKENEIVVAPKILKQVNLQVRLCLGDACMPSGTLLNKLSLTVVSLFGQSKAISHTHFGPSRSYLCMKSVIFAQVHPCRNIARWFRKSIRDMHGLRNAPSWLVQS